MSAPTITRVAAIGLAVAIWAAIRAAGIFPPALFPGPGEVLVATGKLAASALLWSDVAWSVGRVIVGFAIGGVLGVVVGLLTARILVLRQALEVLVQIARPIPVIALVPLSIIWFGIGEPAKWLLIGWATFFPVWVNTHLGASRIPDDYLVAAQVLGATRWRTLREVIFPFATRFIANGLRTAIGIAYVSVVASELSGALHGVGARLNQAYLTYDVPTMMACIAILGVLGAGTDLGLARLIQRTWPWHDGLSYLK